jgi:hypothetical protein
MKKTIGRQMKDTVHNKRKPGSKNYGNFSSHPPLFSSVLYLHFYFFSILNRERWKKMQNLKNTVCAWTNKPYKNVIHLSLSPFSHHSQVIIRTIPSIPIKIFWMKHYSQIKMQIFFSSSMKIFWMIHRMSEWLIEK